MNPVAADRNQADRRLSNQLRAQLSGNDADVYCHTLDDMKEVWAECLSAQGCGETEVLRRYRLVSGLPFDTIPGAAPIISDAVVLVRLAAEMHRSGYIFATYRVIQRNGYHLIIFRGRPGLRRVLTGTVYRSNNPVVIAMGVGQEALTSGARSGLLLTVIVSPVVRSLEALFDDLATWHNVLGNVASDLVKAVVSAGAGLISGLTLSGVTTVASGATIAVAPLATGIGVAILVGVWLNRLDNRHQITDRLIDALVSSHDQWKIDAERVRRDWNHFMNTPRGQIHFMRRFLR